MTLGFDEEKLKVRVKLLDGREISFGGRRVDKLPSAARQISSAFDEASGVSSFSRLLRKVSEALA